MNIRFQTQQLSGLSLLITVLGSLPFYLLVTLMVFLNFDLFITLIGSLALGSLLDRFISEFVERRPQTQLELMQRQIMKSFSSFIPFMSKTPVNPVIRRLTSLCIVLTHFFYSYVFIATATILMLAAIYTEYVELKKPLTTITWGLLIGSISSTIFLMLHAP